MRAAMPNNAPPRRRSGAACYARAQASPAQVPSSAPHPTQPRREPTGGTPHPTPVAGPTGSLRAARWPGTKGAGTHTHVLQWAREASKRESARRPVRMRGLSGGRAHAAPRARAHSQRSGE
eukprot:8360579-Alexandrium_andersonii.AAC.1